MTVPFRLTNDKFKLTPWDNEELSLISVDNRPKPHKTSMQKKTILIQYPRRNKELDLKSPVKIVDYSLPPINSKILLPLNKSSDPIQKRIIQRNFSGRNNEQSPNKYSTISHDQRPTMSFKLNGKKCTYLNSPRQQKWANSFYQNRGYQANIAQSLILNRKKEDVLKSVLEQLNTKVK